jgi:glycosyltransferase involved in cell wall biosynthesis
VTLSEVGGAQSYVSDLVPGLMPDFDVTVAASGEGPLADRVRAAGARFVRLRFLRRDLTPLDLPALFELWLLCLRLRPDIVHANSSKAGAIGRIAAFLAGVRHRVFTTHGWAFAAAEGPAARVYALVERSLRPITSTVICVSEREQHRGLEARACAAGRVLVIQNAVDPARFEPGSSRARHRRRDLDPVELVSVGRLAPPKDFATLLDALAELPRGSARLRIVGDGPERDALEERAHTLRLDAWVSFEGTLPDVAPALGEADVFVLSSRSEGMPMSVLEAMAAGLPVVATDVGGLRELVDEQNGVLVPRDDARSLAEALTRLVVDGDLRRRLGAASRQRAVAGFALPAWRDRHRALYLQLVGDTALAGDRGTAPVGATP